jgi:hypothetical protein
VTAPDPAAGTGTRALLTEVRAPAGARPASLRSDVVAGVVTAVVVVLLGAPAGLLWAHVAPHAALVLTPDGAGLVDPEDRSFLTADVVFAGITLVLGLVCGLVAYAVHRAHGPAVVVGLLVGGLAAAWVAARTGAMVGRDSFTAALLAVAHGAPAGAVRRGPLELRATSVLVAWPVAALAVVASRTAGDARREREHRREQTAQAVSSG